MAKVSNLWEYAAKLNTEVSKSLETAAYTEGREIGPAAALTFTPTSNDVKDYGDGHIVETDTSVVGGTMTIEFNEPTLENEAFLLGYEYNKDGEKGSMIRNANAVAPYIGKGFVGLSKIDNKNVYKAKIYLKVQFRESADEYTTKQDTVTFSHTSMDANFFALDNGDWKTEKHFDTLEEAQTWVKSILGEH